MPTSHELAVDHLVKETLKSTQVDLTPRDRDGHLEITRQSPGHDLVLRGMDTIERKSTMSK